MSEPPGGGRAPPAWRVAYVDADEDYAALLKAMLERQGHAVSTFRSGRSAVAALRAEPESFDVFISDMDMPEARGYLLALGVRAEFPNLRCGLLGGDPYALGSRKDPRAGIVTMPKPESPGDFAAMLWTIVG